MRLIQIDLSVYSTDVFILFFEFVLHPPMYPVEMKWRRFTPILRFRKLAILTLFSLWLASLILVCINSYQSQIYQNQRTPITTPQYHQSHRTNKSDLKLEDVYISVKTSSKHYKTRLQLIFDTWYKLAPDHIHFTTDEMSENTAISIPSIFEKSFKKKIKKKKKRADDIAFTIKFKHHTMTFKHMHVTDCKDSHSPSDLLCKLEAEFRGFWATTKKQEKKWFCHFDDDNYVNVLSLVKKLDTFDADQDWYLGKTRPRGQYQLTDSNNQTVNFWFGTGGAGFCLSLPLVTKMMPYIQNGRFIYLGEELHLNDDVLVGYIVEYLLQTPLTFVDQFHSHLEPQKDVPINDQTLSYSYCFRTYNHHCLGKENILDIPSIFGDDDPSRFKSLHARLFPILS